MNTYQVNQLAITISLSSSDIFLKAVDTLSFATYETKCGPEDLPVGCSIQDTYVLMGNCLQLSDKNHTCEMAVENCNMRISFDAKVGGYLRIKFNVFLRERTTTESGKLGALLSRLETRYNSEMEFIKNAIKELQVFTEALSNAVIVVNTDHNSPKLIPVKTEQLDISYSDFDTSKVALFPRLKTIRCHCSIDSRNENFASNSVETIRFINTHTDLSRLLCNFPNLTYLALGSGCRIDHAKHALTTLPHKLKTFNIFTGILGGEHAEIAQYCASNNIMLVTIN